jgi:16S rRNA (guanine966-N2)-methyltransferase
MFRITCGLFRGKKILLPDEKITRPTSTKARQALFNCLFSCDFNLLDKVVIDCFAGSGAIGLECLSRGAKHAFFIEHNPSTLKVLQNNIISCGCGQDSTIVKSFEALPLSKMHADMIFLDPPYGLLIHSMPAYLYALNQLYQKKWIAPKTYIIIETAFNEELKIEDYAIFQEKIYGNTKLSFIQLSPHL